MQFPAPPSLKTTIIQLNKDVDPEDNNYEILTNEYNAQDNFQAALSSSLEEQPRKKRRRSSSFVDDEELARRRNETKQLHSIIEKRRRIKINREFEALKYIIPACRNSDSGTKRTAGTNNGSKIDGMYKLTILKSSVEYIMYLHHIIQKQHELLSEQEDYDYDISYSRAPLDVNQYRNIDKEFDFTELTQSTIPQTTSRGSKCETIHENEEPVRHLLQPQEQPHYDFDSKPARAKSETFIQTDRQLPSPNITPDMAPILSLLHKYSEQTPLQYLKQRQDKILQDLIQLLSKAFLFQTTHKSGSISSLTSPFTVPIKSQLKKNGFHLPDPALELPNTSASLYPKKMCFKAKVPPTNMVAIVGSDEDEDRLEDASKTLLALRKPSIEKLLN